MSSERKAALILAAIASAEGSWLGLNLYLSTPSRFLHYCGFPPSANLASWALALFIAASFVSVAASRLPSVREHLFRIDGLKSLALLVALASGFCEEVVFRKILMDQGLHQGWSTTFQVGVSALAFGSVHAIWGLFRRKVGAAFGAMCATGLLGCALAWLYLVAERNLAPCIISHMMINLFVEPGLVLAAVRGEMGQQVVRVKPS